MSGIFTCLGEIGHFIAIVNPDVWSSKFYHIA